MIKLRFKNWDKYNKRQKDIKRPFWFAISNEIFLDPFYSELSDQERQAFLWLLCEASRQNKYGEVDVSERLFCQITGYRADILCTTIAKCLKSGRAAGCRQDAGGNTTATEQNRTVQDSTLSHPDGRDDGGDQEELPPPPTQTVAVKSRWDLDAIYREYPARRGGNKKALGLERLAKIIKSDETYDEAMRAVRNYRAEMAALGKVGTEFVAMFASFWGSKNDWREWIDKVPSPSQTQTIRKVIVNLD